MEQLNIFNTGVTEITEMSKRIWSNYNIFNTGVTEITEMNKRSNKHMEQLQYLQYRSN